MTDVKLLKSILKTMREHGCLKLEMPELKVELVPEALLPRTESSSEQVPTEQAYPTQEEIERMVFYSAPSPEPEKESDVA